MAKVLKRMVARDGVEPPTPAFSGLDTVKSKLLPLQPLRHPCGREHAHSNPKESRQDALHDDGHSAQGRKGADHHVERDEREGSADKRNEGLGQTVSPALSSIIGRTS